MLLAYFSVFPPDALAAVQEQLSAPRGTLDVEFAALAEDAPEAVRQRLADLMASEVRQQHRDHPALADPGFVSRREAAVAESVVAHALVEFYNSAHLDVLRRVHAIVFGDGAAKSEDGAAQG